MSTRKFLHGCVTGAENLTLVQINKLQTYNGKHKINNEKVANRCKIATKQNPWP